MTARDELKAILSIACNPCPGFAGACKTMRWAPAQGHVPRGFRGALGSVAEVEFVLVTAEPGDPYPGEAHTGFESAAAYSDKNLRKGTDLYHRKLKHILDLCWEGESLDTQLRKAWLTNSVLCSAPIESGNVAAVVTRECARRFLIPQLEMFRGAVVAALGGKAAQRLERAGVSDFLIGTAAAPPGCNRAGAEKSWQKIADAVKARRRGG